MLLWYNMLNIQTSLCGTSVHKLEKAPFQGDIVCAQAALVQYTVGTAVCREPANTALQSHKKKLEKALDLESN